MGFQDRNSTPDPLGHDEDFLAQSETLDEDDMGVDPLEGGMDASEDWSAANRYGTTATEQATDRPLEERLKEERPDVTIDPVPERPLAATPLEDLDESFDDEVIPGGAPAEQGQVLVGDPPGYLVTEPDAPAADEVSYVREP